MDPNLLTTVAMIALMGVAFYFLILRPQRKRQAEQQATLRSLEPGARVLTSTGIYGTLVRMGEKQAVLEISPGNELTVVKHAVVRVIQPGDEDVDMVGGTAAVVDGEDGAQAIDADPYVAPTADATVFPRTSDTDDTASVAHTDGQTPGATTKSDRPEGH